MLFRWVGLSSATIVLSLFSLWFCGVLASHLHGNAWNGAVIAASQSAGSLVRSTNDARVLYLSTTFEGVTGYLNTFFPENAIGLTRLLIVGYWPGYLAPDQRAAAWWCCAWLTCLCALGIVALDPLARGRVTNAKSPRRSTCCLFLLASAAFWLGVVPPLFIAREFVNAFWISVGVASSTPTTFGWTSPRAATPGATLGCLMLAAASVVILARLVVWGRRTTPDGLDRARLRLCRTCAYAVGDLARCPECGDAEPRRPGPYFITRLGSWIHAKAWRRWGLRTFVVAWIAVTLLLPAIVGYAQMIGSRAGWW